MPRRTVALAWGCAVLLAHPFAGQARAQTPADVRPAPSPAGPTPRALWLWEPETFEILDDSGAREAALDFFVRHAVTTVYVYADSWRGRNPIVEEPAKYRAFVTRLAERGIAAYALLGSAPLNTPRYVLPENRARAEAMVERVLDYNAGSAPGERFTGLNLDIEPYLLPDWEERRGERALQYLELSRRLVEMVRQSGQDLSVGPASPFWFDTVQEITFEGSTKPLHEHVQDVHDYVALMDYRDTAEGPDGILAHGARELEYAGRTGKSVVIGVETLRASPGKLTFYEEGLAVMERELAEVLAAWGSRPGFGGFAIHHYRTFRALADRTPGNPTRQPS